MLLIARLSTQRNEARLNSLSRLAKAYAEQAAIAWFAIGRHELPDAIRELQPLIEQYRATTRGTVGVTITVAGGPAITRTKDAVATADGRAEIVEQGVEILRHLDAARVAGIDRLARIEARNRDYAERVRFWLSADEICAALLYAYVRIHDHEDTAKLHETLDTYGSRAYRLMTTRKDVPPALQDTDKTVWLPMLRESVAAVSFVATLSRSES